MGIVVGKAREHGFDDPLGMMGDCHRRVERFLADQMAVAAAGTLAEGGRERLAHALRYFQEGAPRHTADEDHSVFPRLRRHGKGLRELDQLAADHGRAEPLHAEANRLTATWLAAGDLEDDDLDRLRDVLDDLAELYAAHIHLEDEVIFPMARNVLTGAELEAVAREMAARRGVDFDRWRATVHALAQ